MPFLAFASLVSAHASEAKERNLLLLPFNPPLQQDLRYDVTRTITSSAGTKITKSEQILRYETQESGYVLTLRYVSFSSAGTTIKLDSPDGVKSVPIEMRAFLMPLSFDVDKVGSLLRVRDWPKVRAAIAKVPEFLAAQDKSRDQETAISVGNRVLGPILNLTAEQAANQIPKGWSSVMGLGGLELEEGVALEANGESPSGMLPVAIPNKIRFSMVRSSNSNRLHFTQTSIPDEAALGAALSNFMARLADGLPAQQRANIEKGADLMRRMRIQDRIDADFDSHTGVVENGLLERTITMDGLGQGGETITIAKLP